MINYVFPPLKKVEKHNKSLIQIKMANTFILGQRPVNKIHFIKVPYKS